MLKSSPLFLLTLVGLSSAVARADVKIALRVAAWQHITFKDIPSTQYIDDQNAQDGLQALVKQSSSFLLLPFATTRRIQKIAFEWQALGTLNTKNAAAERTKAGDDAFLRLGLVIKGNQPPMLPFFAPAWLKATQSSLKHAADKLLYFVVGSKNPVGSLWPSPYSDSITMQVLKSESSSDGWQKASVDLPHSSPVVGLWLMADGDNTHSTFVTKLRHLRMTFDAASIE